MDFLQECRFGRTHVGERLTGFGSRKKYDEIDRMTTPQRNAHLGFALEAADTAAVAGARIDDHPWPSVLARGHSALAAGEFAPAHN